MTKNNCTCDPEDVGPTGHGAECPVFKTRSLGSAIGLLDEAYAAFQKSGQPERDWTVLCELVVKNSLTLEDQRLRAQNVTRGVSVALKPMPPWSRHAQELWESARPKGCYCPFGMLLGDCPEHGYLVPE